MPSKKPESKRRKRSSKPEEEDSRSTTALEDKHLNAMRHIFESVQKGYTHQVKNIEKMWELQHKYNDTEKFFDDFWYCLQHACLVAAREPPTERVIQFACKFAIRADSPREALGEEEVSQTGPFAVRLFHTALQYTEANDKAVRFRLCQIINLMLTSLGADASIDEDLFNKIYTGMLERLKDKVPVVRVQAVNTLNRLQDPADPDCPIIQGYLNIMKSDGVGEVRRAAVKAIALNSKTILPVIERGRDVNPGVRKAVYEVLIDKVSIRSMRISHRMKLLQDGLKDRNEGVQHACKKLIQKWLLYHESDIIRLLKALDVEGKADICMDVVKETLSKLPMEKASDCLYNRMENNVVPPAELTPEVVFYWRALIEYSQVDYPNVYDRIMPTLTVFSSYLKDYVHMASQIPAEDYDAHYQASYIIVELIKIAKLADFSDEAGRKNLISINKHIITEAEITVQAVERLVELLGIAEPDEQTRIKSIAEVINDIRNPLEGSTQHNIESIESCEKNDPVTLIRCLTLVSGLVKGVKCDVAFDPTLSGLLDDIIMSGVISENEIVRHLAIKALGYSCILSKTLAKKYLVFFLQVVMVDNYTEILETTLKIIFDLLLVFGLETFSDDDMTKKESDDNKANVSDEDLLATKLESTTLERDQHEGEDNISKNAKESKPFEDQIVEKFKEFLDDEILRNVAAEGIAKLMYNNRLVDATLFSRMLLLWYNPTTEGDSLRHCLGMFFSTYGANDNMEALTVIEEAFFPTIQTICDAPHVSPLLEINPQRVAELMLSLLRGYHNEQMIIKMCNEILINPRSSYGKCLTKVLHHCSVDGERSSDADIKLIHSLVMEIKEQAEHISTKKALLTYLGVLETMVKKTPYSEDKENKPPDHAISADGSQDGDVLSQMSDMSEVSVGRKKSLYAAPDQPLDLLDMIT